MGKNTIGFRLRISFAILILVSTVGGFFSYRMMTTSSTYYETKIDITEIDAAINKAEELINEFLLEGRKEVDFLEDNESELTQSIESQLNSLQRDLDIIVSNKAVAALGLETELLNLKNALVSYTFKYKSLQDAYYKRGFKDHGLVGDMRDYVHDLQELSSKDEQLYAFQLRRREKDYFLRLDTRYVELLHELTDEFKYFLESNPQSYTADYARKASLVIDAYENQFNKVVDLDRSIGFTADLGLRGELKMISTGITPRISFLKGKMDEAVSKLTRQAVYVLASSVISMVVAAILFTIMLSRSISRPIRQLDHLTQRITNEDASEDHIRELNVLGKLNSEIGNLANNFRQLLQHVMDQMTEMKRKNTELEDNKAKDDIRNWISQGLVQFNEVLRKKSSLDEIMEGVLQFIIKYADLNQGAMYVLEEKARTDQHIMKMITCYAYGKKKMRKDTVMLGEGLVGQVWREQETAYLTEIPESYIEITSGLGRDLPQSLLIIPLNSDERVEGIIELASLKSIDSHKIEWIEMIAERLARSVSSIKMQDTTTKLLEETQQMTEELRASEEEMRQNMEELQATQEEMARNQHESNQLVKRLEYHLGLYENIVNKVYEGVIITDGKEEILYANAYAKDKLRYGDIIFNTPVSKIINVPFENVINRLSSDDHFAKNEFSKILNVELKDRDNQVVKVGLVVTTFREGAENRYVFLFNAYDFSTDDPAINDLFNKSYIFSSEE